MSAHPGELAFQGDLLVWINETIKAENLPFDGASQEFIMKGQERPDILLWKNKRAREVALLLSLKVPYYDAWDAADDALLKASKWPGGIRYFSTWNINNFFLWDKTKLGDLYDALCYQKEVAKINRVEEYERIEDSLRSFIKEFLKEFTEVYYERKLLPPLAIDERFIFRIRSAVDAFSIPTFFMIRDGYKDDKEFRDKLKRWFAEQGWTFFGKDGDYEKVARQYVYLLIDKIMFYNILKLRNRELPKITVPLNIDGEQFRKEIQSYFNIAIKIDYVTIFATNFLDTIPIPDELTGQLRSFIDKIGDYDYSKVGYEILGRVFERLIPDRERHNLGQYYTRSDVVDLIVAFCVRSADDKVLDGACGAGTFLVRSYLRKGLLNPSKEHEELIDDLYGIDIAKFPAHLTTINLAVRDLSSLRNYPRVITKDFFDVKGKEKIRILGEDYAKQYPTLGLDLEKFIIEIPECDAVVMNPPYTRQEEMEEGIFSEGYRIRLQELVKQEWKDFYVGKRSSIYSYFFTHGAKFLNEHGRLGLITSNSWLDVDYGKYLQEFFLKNFKVIAIIESKVEKWFEDADINTAITILEKCSNKKERMNNLIKFVYLKKPLTHYILPTDDERKRWNYVQFLVDKVEKVKAYYEDDELRVFVKKQKELWDEGYNGDNGVYEGSKWGKYIRAPEILFKILCRSKNLFIPLKEVAKMVRGFSTGVNEFFYLTKDRIKKFNIEKKFIRPLVRTARELSSLRISQTQYWLFYCNKTRRELTNTYALKYIQWGEKQRFHENPTCKGRQPWYALGERECGSLFIRKLPFGTYSVALNEAKAYPTCNVYELFPSKTIKKALASLLNSTLSTSLFESISRTALGGGAGAVMVYEIKQLPVIDPSKLSGSILDKLEKAFDMLSKRQVDIIFEEIGADSSEEVLLDKVKPDRRELDKIIMGEILGLTEDEQLEVYRAVIDLVKSRIEKAKSVPKKAKRVKGLDVEALVNDVISEVGKLKSFPEDFISLEGINYKEVPIPKGRAEVGQDLYGFYVEIEKEKIRCDSPYEARYIQYSSLNGKTIVKLPEDESLILKAVSEYRPIIEEALKRIDEYLNSTIPDNKLRKKVKDEVWLRITGQK